MSYLGYSAHGICNVNFAVCKHRKFESVWSILPLGIVLWFVNMIVICLYYFDDISLAYDVFDVIGFQWYWSFEQFDICFVSSENLMLGNLYLLETVSWIMLPANTVVKIFVSSVDVIHSFCIPSLGIKLDAIPGRINCCWIIGNVCGIYYGQCSELCGSLHGFMPIKLAIV